MAWLNSEKIKVFPSAFRGLDSETSKTYNPESRLNSENNFANLSNRFASYNNGCFVISYDNTNKILKFVMHGYYFEVLHTDTISEITSTGDVYAHIIIKALNNETYSGTNYEAYSLVSQQTTTNEDTSRTSGNTHNLDDGGIFYGICFDNSSSNKDYTYTLHLLRNGSVPEESKLILDTTHIKDSGVNNKPISNTFTTQNLDVISTIDLGDNATIKGNIVLEKDLFTANSKSYSLNSDGGKIPTVELDADGNLVIIIND